MSDDGKPTFTVFICGTKEDAPTYPKVTVKRGYEQKWLDLGWELQDVHQGFMTGLKKTFHTDGDKVVLEWRKGGEPPKPTRTA